MPVLYAVLGAGIGTTAALYAAFSSFAALVFADFQGAPRQRLEGYGVLAALGGSLVLFGSAVAEIPVAPALAFFAVTFGIRFVGCLGGYAVAAGTTLMLAFALAVMTTPVVEIDQRLAGWVIGCVAAAASMVAPLPRRLIARDRLAAQCRALAADLRARVAATSTEPPSISPVRQVREELTASSSRPLTPTAGQTALGALLDAVGRATLLCQHLPADADLSAGDVGTDRLALVGADAFDAAAAAAAITDGAAVDLHRAHDALAEQRVTMVAALTGPGSDRRQLVEDAATTTMRIRFLTSLGAVSTAAATWMGHRPDSNVTLDVEVELPEGGPGPFWHRARQTTAFHLRWQSTRFRNSLRAAVALTASLTLARIVDFDHAFWVVLGTLMVLRSAVNDTTATALQALRGTLIGFAIAAPLAWAANGHDTLLWVLLPFAAFLAAWAPGAIGLGFGQASFTIFVVVLFNLAAPSGAQTAFLRLETVATGVVVAVVSGFVFWPRGPQASLGPIAGRLYRASAATLRAVSAETLGLVDGREGLARSRHEQTTAREELEETLQELAADHRAPVSLTDRVAIMIPPALVRAGDWSHTDLSLGTIGPADGRPSSPPPELEAEAFEVASRFEAVADGLENPRLPGAPLAQARPDGPTARRPPGLRRPRAEIPPSSCVWRGCGRG